VEKIGIRRRRVRRREEDWELEGPHGKSIPSTKHQQRVFRSNETTLFSFLFLSF